MNVLPSQLRSAGIGLEVEVAGRWFRVADHGLASSEVLRQYVGQRISVGLRPETLFVVVGSEAMLEPVLVDVEELGHEQLLYCTLAQAQTRMIVRRSGCAVANIGNTLPLGFDPEQLYYFNAQGDAIYS